MGRSPVNFEDFLSHYDHLNADFALEPFQVWAKMREACPMAHSDQHGGFWVPTRYEDMDRIAHDVATFSNRKTAIPAAMFEGEVPPLTSDPPVHTSFRRLLLPAFSPKEVAAWEPATWELADRLIDGFIDRPEFDGAQEFARDIPITITSRMLGVSEDDRDKFADWILRAFEVGPGDPEGVHPAFLEIITYLSHRIEERRDEPKDDIITFLVNSEIDGEPLDGVKIAFSCLLLLVAGIDTTWSAIGSSLHHLAGHPDDRRRLVEALDEPDSELWTSAIEEFLRAFAPVSMARYVAKDVEMGGRSMHEGDMVLLPYGAANRDPEAFDLPEEVILDRKDNRHLAFGIGIHRCLGSNLARMELRVALQAFLRRIPEFEVADPDRVRYSTGQIRGPRELPFAIKAAT